MFLANINSNVDFDIRLNLALAFVCELIKVTKKDFASLAISNLLAEELNFIQNNNFEKFDSNQLNIHKKAVNIVKYESDGWVINRK